MACGGTCGCKDCGSSSPQVLWPDGARAAPEACGCGGWVEPPSHDPRGVPAGLGASGAQFGVSPPSATRRARVSIAAADAAASSVRLAVPRVAGPFEPVDADPVGALARADAGARRAPRLRAASAFEPQDATLLAAFGPPRSRRRGAVTAPDTQVPRDRPTRRQGSGVASPGMHWDPRVQQGEVRLPDGMGSADRPGELRPPQAVEDRPSPEDLAILHRTQPAPTAAPPDGAVVATAPSVADRGEVAAGLRRGGDASPSGPARAAIPYGTAAGAGRQDLGELGGSSKRGKGGGGGGAGGAAPAGSPPVAPQVGGAPGPGGGNPVAPGGGGGGPGNPPAPKPPAVTTPSCDCTCTCEPDGTTTLRIQTTRFTLDANGQAVPDRPVQYPIVLGPPVSPIRNGLPLLAPAGTTLGGTKVGGFHVPVEVPPQSVSYGAAAGLLGAADDTGRVSPVGFPGTLPYDPPDDRGSALAIEVGSGQLTQIVLARAEAGARMDAVGRTGIQATTGADGPGVQTAFSQTAFSQTATAGPRRALRDATGVLGAAPAGDTPGAAGTAGGASTGFYGIRGPGGSLGDALPPPPAGEPERAGRGDPPPGAPPPGAPPPGAPPIGPPPPTPPPPTFVAGGGGGSKGSALNAEEIARPPLWSDEPPPSRPAPPPRSPALHPAGAFGGDGGLVVPPGAVTHVGTLHPGGSSPLQWQPDPTATRSRRTLAPFGGAGTLDRRDAPTDARRLHAGGGMDAGARVRPPLEASGTQATVPRYLAEFDALNTGGQKGGLDDPFGWGGATAGDTQRGGLSRVTVDWLAMRGGHAGAAPTPVAPPDVAGAAVRASLGNDLPGAVKRGVAQAARGPVVAGGDRTSVDEAAAAERDAQFVLPAAPPASGGNPAAQFPVVSREPTGPRGLAPGGTFATTPPTVDREWKVRSPQGGHLGSSANPAAEQVARTMGTSARGGGGGGSSRGKGGGGGASGGASERFQLQGAQEQQARSVSENEVRRRANAEEKQGLWAKVYSRDYRGEDPTKVESRLEAALDTSKALNAEASRLAQEQRSIDGWKKDLARNEAEALRSYQSQNPTDGTSRYIEDRMRADERIVGTDRRAGAAQLAAGRRNDRYLAKLKTRLSAEEYAEVARDVSLAERTQLDGRKDQLHGLDVEQRTLEKYSDSSPDERKRLDKLRSDEARRDAERADIDKRQGRLDDQVATIDSELAARQAKASDAKSRPWKQFDSAGRDIKTADDRQAELAAKPSRTPAEQRELDRLTREAPDRKDKAARIEAQRLALGQSVQRASARADARERNDAIHALRDLAGKSIGKGAKGHADATLFKGLIGDLKKGLLSPADIARILSQPQSAWAAAREALRRKPPTPAGGGPRDGDGNPGPQQLVVATVYPEGSRGDDSAVVVQFVQNVPDLSGGVLSAGTPKSPPQVPGDPCSPSCYSSAPCPCPPGQTCKCSPKVKQSGGGSGGGGGAGGPGTAARARPGDAVTAASFRVMHPSGIRILPVIDPRPGSRLEPHLPELCPPLNDAQRRAVSDALSQFVATIQADAGAAREDAVDRVRSEIQAGGRDPSDFTIRLGGAGDFTLVDKAVRINPDRPGRRLLTPLQALSGLAAGVAGGVVRVAKELPAAAMTAIRAINSAYEEAVAAIAQSAMHELLDVLKSVLPECIFSKLLAAIEAAASIQALVDAIPSALASAAGVPQEVIDGFNEVLKFVLLVVGAVALMRVVVAAAKAVRAGIRGARRAPNARLRERKRPGGGPGSSIGSVDDVIKDPNLLKGGTRPEELLSKIGGRPPEGWKIETLRKGSHAGEGWVLREYTPRGDPTGRMIRWHPGGGHHGPEPYWRVVDSSGPSEIIR